MSDTQMSEVKAMSDLETFEEPEAVELGTLLELTQGPDAGVLDASLAGSA